MALVPGTRLGPYEILGPIGAGGMGEVYRARDARLQREVAVKVLPASFVADPERLRRFEQEARATGQLNHPNILVVYDTGTHDGAPYVVAELLEGGTLRARMAGGPLMVRKALDYARQITLGLAAAHQKGIVHRDLKPENLFVTNDGRVKILDFGLAKLTRPEGADALPAEALTSAPTRADTGAGVVLGTAGYMSPEQVRGQPTDQRSDIFAFGSILYEMLTGRRAFAADSSVETMNAILKEDPPEITRATGDLPPGLERIVQHCLEKSPDERFQSARDLGFQLEALSAMSSASMTASGATAAIGAGAVGAGAGAAGRARRGTRIVIAAAIALAALVAAAAYYAGTRTHAPAGPVVYRQLTFRQGSIFSARFTPDGDSVIYAASWDGKPAEVFTTRPGSPESRSLGLPTAEVLAVSPSGELALLLDSRYTIGWMRSGTLARAPLSGGVPREILRDVEDADWAPDGEGLAVIRSVAGRYRLEYPTGKVLYETTAWLGSPRFSRDGKRIAFIDHPGLGDNRGRAAVVDLGGKVTFLTEPFSAAGGVAWSPAGDEIWFTAGTVGMVRALLAVDLAGNVRTVDGAPADMEVSDVSPAGKILVVRNASRRGILGTRPGDDTERDLSWLDWSRPGALSADGEWLLFEEQGQGGGEGYSVYLRRTDGSPAVRLGGGYASALSWDGKWALTGPIDKPDRLVFAPRGPGESRTIAFPGFRIQWARFLPDDKRLVLAGSEGDHLPRLYLTDTAGAPPKPITPETIDFTATFSPDGRQIASSIAGGVAEISPIEGGDRRPVAGSVAGDAITAWSPDGRSLLVGVTIPGGTRLDSIDLATGARRPWKTLMPADRAGLLDLAWVVVSADFRAYAYSYRRNLSTLYQVDGLR